MVIGVGRDMAVFPYSPVYGPLALQSHQRHDIHLADVKVNFIISLLKAKKPVFLAAYWPNWTRRQTTNLEIAGSSPA